MSLNNDDSKDNLKILNLSIDSHSSLIEQKEKFSILEKRAMTNIYKRYGPKAKLKYTYTGLIMDSLIFNKNTHLVAEFKNFMILDYIEEFLKRFYNDYESKERIPKFESFYKNYLVFFCRPTLCDFYINEMIHDFAEKKAELFYNNNYKKKGEKESNSDEGIYEDSSSDSEEDTILSKTRIEKTIFNETIKKKIEKYSPINTSMALPDSEARLKTDQSGLLITDSNENSLRNIISNMIPNKVKKDKKENKKISNKKKESNKEKEFNKRKQSQSQRVTNDYENLNTQKQIISDFIKANIKISKITNIKKNSRTLSNLFNPDKNNNIKESDGKTFNFTLERDKMMKNNKKQTNSNKNIHNNDKQTNNDINTILTKNTYIREYKKKNIPIGRNSYNIAELKNSNTQQQCHVDNISLSNYLQNINNNNKTLKKNSHGKNLSSINTYGNNLPKNASSNADKSRNCQKNYLSSGNYSNINVLTKYCSFDKFFTNKNKNNGNIINTKNIELILNQLRAKPLCALKKFQKRKSTNTANKNTNNKEQSKTRVFSEENISKSKKKSNTIKTTDLNLYLKNYTITNFLKNNNKLKIQNNYSNTYKNKIKEKEIENKKTTYKNSASINIYNTLINSHGSKYKKNPKIRSERKSEELMKLTFDGILSKNNNNAHNNTLNKKDNNVIGNNQTQNLNINININNHINIRSKHTREILSLSDVGVKNVGYSSNSLKKMYANRKKVFSRNKNSSLDFMSTGSQNNNVNSNYPSTTVNYKYNPGLNENLNKQEQNSIFRTKNKMKNAPSDTNKIQFLNNNIYKSMKSLFNNNYIYRRNNSKQIKMNVSNKEIIQNIYNPTTNNQNNKKLKNLKKQKNEHK